VIEDQGFGFGAFEEQLPVIGAGERPLENRQSFVGIDSRPRQNWGFEQGRRRDVDGHAGEDRDPIGECLLPPGSGREKQVYRMLTSPEPLRRWFRVAGRVSNSTSPEPETVISTT